MTRETSRRKLLLGIGAGATMALAGCSELPGSNGEPSPSNFEYPDGFSEEGVDDFATAMGTESAHYAAESFSFESEYQFEQPDSEEDQVITASSEVSGANKTQHYRTETAQVVQEQYHDGTQAYLRYYSKEQEQSQYQIQEVEFSREGAYMINLFRDQFQNVSFEVDEVLSAEEVRYIATKEDVPDDHAFFQQYENVAAMTLTFTVNTDGYVIDTEVNITRDLDGDELDESYAFSFSDFNNTTVEEPDWLGDAEEFVQQQQSGEDTTEDTTTTTTTTTDDTTEDQDSTPTDDSG